ncbi:hypothetical protein PM3016_4776 [Paenibacillus mucilaginosus 3016]|uniref:RNA-binding protein KhpB N-terminal domain-containing protein n=1 Tax=Paenibacillus mucilaginosus 3016 TaxID=1116391 RepID=H6NIB1_9BACL|nr:FapA family protein [Paenibacillus mucilaginosus]AFC31514.1 hypothetical protein PM3016_4776 [Paenibacillus mucilaginosus 3016]WFA20057.1 DUF342 domain-containing protein [Paenibacillus mucilaginosus]
MGESIVSRGKTVKDAVELALDLLDAEKKDVTIEIIETESRGLFGIGSKQAVVKVTRKTAVPQEAAVPDLRERLETLDLDTLLDAAAPPAAEDSHKLGKAWVKEGKIHCRDAEGAMPLITAGEGIQLFKNGAPVDKTTTIAEKEVFTVQLDDEFQEPQWKLSMDDRKMAVVLEIKPGFHISRYLKDQPPAAHLKISVEEIKSVIRTESQDILRELDRWGVKFGIQIDEITEACRSSSGGTYTIARGKEPEPGENGKFQRFFDADADRTRAPKVRADGTIDHREIKEFPSVDEGVLIGALLPPVPGAPGIDVTGQKVEPEPVHPLQLRAGEGMTLIENDSKALSTKPGKPKIVQRGLVVDVLIVPKMVHGTDVDLESGNIHFQGDLEILGSVQDGMKVSAQGEIIVRGNVNMADIRAKHSLVVSANVISSQITVGAGSLLTAKALPLLRQVSGKLKLMKAAVIQVGQASAFKSTDYGQRGIWPLLHLLLQGKFKDLQITFTRLLALISEEERSAEPELLQVAERIRKNFTSQQSGTLSDVQDLEQFIVWIDELLEVWELTADDQPYCEIAYAHNSTIYCEGSVRANKGCYNSQIHCYGHFEAKEFLRGGEYYARGGIRAVEAGSNGGSTTKLHVPEDSEIRIGRVMENTVLRIGPKTHHFEKETASVHARLDSNGNLLLY